MKKEEKGLLLFVISILFILTAGAVVFFTMNSYTFEPSPYTLETPYYPESDSCQMLSCHGTDVQCGIQKGHLQCDMMYQIGDSCRQYARCQTIEGECTLIKEDFFDTCVSCVEKCQETSANSDDPSEVFLCENSCLEGSYDRKLLKICPDEKIENAMPGSFDDALAVPQEEGGFPLPREYFILNGERREIEEFDTVWVEENCSVGEQIVW